MAEKRIEITQALCRQVQLLIKGGASNKEAGQITGTSAATVSRIRSADYDAAKYQQNTEARRAKVFEMEKAENLADIGEQEVKRMVQQACDQVPGQIRMFLPGDGQPPVPLIDENKLMRFLAGKMEQQAAKQDEILRELMRELGEMLIDMIKKLDKINDNLCQVLRKLDR